MLSSRFLQIPKSTSGYVPQDNHGGNTFPSFTLEDPSSCRAALLLLQVSKIATREVHSVSPTLSFESPLSQPKAPPMMAFRPKSRPRPRMLPPSSRFNSSSSEESCSENSQASSSTKSHKFFRYEETADCVGDAPNKASSPALEQNVQKSTQQPSISTKPQQAKKYRCRTVSMCSLDVAPSAERNMSPPSSPPSASHATLAVTTTAVFSAHMVSPGSRPVYRGSGGPIAPPPSLVAKFNMSAAPSLPLVSPQNTGSKFVNVPSVDKVKTEKGLDTFSVGACNFPVAIQFPSGTFAGITTTNDDLDDNNNDEDEGDDDDEDLKQEEEEEGCSPAAASPRTAKKQFVGATLLPPGNGTVPVIKAVLRKKFSWKSFPELEAYLIQHRPQYLQFSSQLNYTAEQKRYNNSLTQGLLDLAADCGYVFDGFTFPAIRDRIRCYYKSYVQAVKKKKRKKRR